MSKKKKKSSKKESQPSPTAAETTKATPLQPSATTASSQPSHPASKQTYRSNVSRYISLGLLIAVILIFVFLFYEVMAKFLVPLFLAALLVVVFRPLHRWILEKCGGRETLGAMVTTAAIMLTVLVPICLLLVLAAAEGRAAFKQFNTAQIYDGVKKVRTSLKLDLPKPVQIIETELQQAQQAIGPGADRQAEHDRLLGDVYRSAQQISEEKSLPWQVLPAPSESATDDESTQSSKGTAWEKFTLSVENARAMHAQMDWTPSESEDEKIAQDEALHNYQMQLNEASEQFSEFKPQLLGGKTKAAIVDLVNPSDDDTKQYIENGTTFLKENLVGFSRTGASFLASLLLGTGIMTIGLYFFLLDGPKMLESFKGLSPIDDEHEEELAVEFARVSRAVVVATLLSALVQGLLAGIGFYFVGLDSIILLTVLSAVLAMVPFVGAAAVWVPCSLYLFFFQNNVPAAIGLAVYGVAIISMADNVIKPYVLHGQSNLHPQLALLSVLGGVATLGPIGILIGPMVVAFLQTLLKILQREMRDLDQMPALATNGPPTNGPPAEHSPEEAPVEDPPADEERISDS